MKNKNTESEAMESSPSINLPLSKIPIRGNRYHILRILGKGAFAETYLAEDSQKNIHVAIKVFHPDLVETWKSYELFEREVNILQALDYPGIPRIFDYFEAEEPQHAAYVVMEYIEGETLSTMISRKQTLDPQKSVDLFTRLLDILEYLHSRVPPVLHRDIKPGNIIIRTSGLPVLIDFGSVRVVFQKPDEKGSTIVGTHGYMPYEQYLGQASPSSDLYALAATFLEVLTSRPPSDFLTGKGTIDVPDGLTGGPHFIVILKKMLAHAKDDRYQSVEEVKEALFAPIFHQTPQSLVPATVSRQQLAIPEAPRKITPSLQPYIDQFAPSFLRYVAVGTDGNIPKKVPADQWTLIALGSILTVGILPICYWYMYRKEKTRLKKFFEKGNLVCGTIAKIAHGRANSIRVYHVLYSFQVNGKTYRGAQDLRPQMAQFWGEQTPVLILYMPDDPNQNIIIGEATEEGAL